MLGYEATGNVVGVALVVVKIVLLLAEERCNVIRVSDP